MSTKVVQIPMDASLLEALDAMARQRGQPRSALIREACRSYLKQAEQEQLDKTYLEGYRRLPEEPGAGLAQEALAAEVLAEESW